MEGEPETQSADVAGCRKARTVTVHGERATLWHVVDANAPESEQPAVLRTFSSANATRVEAEQFLRDVAERP